MTPRVDKEMPPRARGKCTVQLVTAGGPRSSLLTAAGTLFFTGYIHIKSARVGYLKAKGEGRKVLKENIFIALQRKQCIYKHTQNSKEEKKREKITMKMTLNKI